MIHTVRDTMTGFAENNIQAMEWPPNSPDLILIEYCWKRLKEKLYQHFSNIHKTKKRPYTIRTWRYLIEVLNLIWTQDIEWEFLESLWEPMPRREITILGAKRWYAKYWFFFSAISDESFFIFNGCVHRFSVYSKQL